ENLEQKYNDDESFVTEVKEIVKGGLVVDVGVRGFIPASLVETYFVDDFSDYKNKELEVKVVDLDKEQNRVILSNRAIVEEEAEKNKQQIVEELKKGEVLKGTVQRLIRIGPLIYI